MGVWAMYTKGSPAHWREIDIFYPMKYITLCAADGARHFVVSLYWRRTVVGDGRKKNRTPAFDMTDIEFTKHILSTQFSANKRAEGIIPFLYIPTDNISQNEHVYSRRTQVRY